VSFVGSNLSHLSLVYRVLADRVAELESAVKNLEQHIQAQTLQAGNEIKKWQVSCGSAEEKCSQLQKQLETVTRDKDSMSSKLADLESDFSMFELEKAGLEDEVSSLEKKLAAAKEMASKNQEDETEGNTDYVGSLEAQLRETEDYLRQAREGAKFKEDVLHQSQGMRLSFTGSFRFPINSGVLLTDYSIVCRFRACSCT
jgi:chromosome segregation ATPase